MGTDKHDQRIANLIFGDIYPHYVSKVEKKGKTKEDLLKVIHWLTGYNENDLDILIKEKATFETFFRGAQINPNAKLIVGLVCGVRVESIETPLTQQIRYLDKLVDELARGKKMENILRK